MGKTTIAAVIVCLASGLLMPLGAQNGPGGNPNENLKSTEVLPDGRVIFRIYAPKASEVSLSGDWVLHGRGTAGAMKKGSDGVWSLTVGPLVPDFYEYSFTVDGVRTADPKNMQMETSVESINNILEVPGPGEEFEATNPVPHGEIRQVFYQSSILGQTRRMHIYTPPGYNTSQEKYPVLYLINGGGQEDSGWSSMGRAGFIMDNLIAANKAKPMIVVMPNGTVSLPGITPAMIAREAQRTPEGNSIRVASLAKLHEAFIDDLMTKIIPYTEKNYSVLTGPDQRAVAGLSMGGQETIRAGIGRFGQFGYLGVWSMGPQPGFNGPFLEDFEQRNAEFFRDPAHTNKVVKLLWIGVGRDDYTVGKGPKHLADGLEKHGINFEYHETQGGHTWINWRQYLNEFAPRLFR